MDDFADKVKQKLETNCQVALFTSLDQKPLRPGLEIADLLKSDLVASNSDENPLFVRLSPVVQDAVVTKTIDVGVTDDDGVFTCRYKERIIRNDYDLQKVIKNADGLIHPSSSNRVLVSFDDIQDGEKYLFDRVAHNFQAWQKKEADAMEAETLLEMKSYLADKLIASPVDLPTDFHDSDGRQIQEWDGALLLADTLYLLEAKHSMSEDKIKNIAARVETFSNALKQSKHKHLSGRFSNIVGVACGAYFPDDGRNGAHRLGVMVIYPSGRRYVVEIDKMDSDFAIER